MQAAAKIASCLLLLLVAAGAVENERASSSSPLTEQTAAVNGTIVGNVRHLTEDLISAFNRKDWGFLNAHVDDDSVFVTEGELPGHGIYKGLPGLKNALYAHLLNVKGDFKDTKFNVLAVDEGRQFSILETTCSGTFVNSGRSVKDIKIIHFIQWFAGKIRHMRGVPEDYATLRNAYYTDNEMTKLNFTMLMLTCGDCAADLLANDVQVSAPGMYPPALGAFFSFRGKKDFASYLSNQTWFAKNLQSSRILLSQPDTGMVLSEETFAASPIIPLVKEYVISQAAAGKIADQQSLLQPFVFLTTTTVKDGKITNIEFRATKPLTSLEIAQLVQKNVVESKEAVEATTAEPAESSKPAEDKERAKDREQQPRAERIRKARKGEEQPMKERD